MTLLPVRVPAGDEASVKAICPGDRSVGVDLAGVAAGAVGEAPVIEYASTVGAGFSLPPSAIGGAGISTVSISNPVSGQYWPREQDN